MGIVCCWFSFISVIFKVRVKFVLFLVLYIGIGIFVKVFILEGGVFLLLFCFELLFNGLRVFLINVLYNIIIGFNWCLI